MQFIRHLCDFAVIVLQWNYAGVVTSACTAAAISITGRQPVQPAQLQEKKRGEKRREEKRREEKRREEKRRKEKKRKEKKRKEKKRKEKKKKKATPKGVNLMRSQVLYRAAQISLATDTQSACPIASHLAWMSVDQTLTKQTMTAPDGLVLLLFDQLTSMVDSPRWSMHSVYTPQGRKSVE